MGTALDLIVDHPDTATETSSAELLDATILAIEQDPSLEWSLERLTELTGMSRSTLCTRFRQVTGDAPMRFVRRCRLVRAAEYLYRGDESLPEIADRIGYDSEASLSKAFKRRYGLAPGAYRKAVRVLGPGRLPVS